MNGACWKPYEIGVLKELYEHGKWDAMYRKLPGRTRSAIINKARGLGIERHEDEIIDKSLRTRKANRDRLDMSAFKGVRNPDKAFAEAMEKFGGRF